MVMVGRRQATKSGTEMEIEEIGAVEEVDTMRVATRSLREAAGRTVSTNHVTTSRETTTCHRTSTRRRTETHKTKTRLITDQGISRTDRREMERVKTKRKSSKTRTERVGTRQRSTSPSAR